MKLNMTTALDTYKTLSPSFDWSATAITVDKLTNRLVMYYLGDKKVVEYLKVMKLSDGSCDVNTVLECVDQLKIVFAFNGRNGVLDVYRCDGIFEDMPLPFPVHMERFLDAMTEYLKYEDKDTYNPVAWNVNVAGGASGADAGVDGRDEPMREGLKWNLSEAGSGKYNPMSTRKTAMASFKESQTYKNRKVSRDSVNLDDLIPKDMVEYIPPPAREDSFDDEFVDAVRQLAKIEKPVEKPRILGIIGLISNLLDRMGNKDE